MGNNLLLWFEGFGVGFGIIYYYGLYKTKSNLIPKNITIHHPLNPNNLPKRILHPLSLIQYTLNLIIERITTNSNI